MIPLLLAPAVMAVATLIEKRLGPSAAGWVGALPAAFAVAVIAVSVDIGPGAAAAMALSAAAHVPAQVALGVVFAHVLRRRGLAVGFAAGLAAYIAASLLIAGVPAALAVAVAVAVLCLAPRVMPAAPLRPASPRSRRIVALTCAGATLIVAAAVLTSRLAGPDPAGTVAAFPTMCTILTVVAVTRDGAAAGVHTLTGLIRSLPCYLAFCVTVAVAVPFAGIAAVGIGLLSCLLAAACTWKRVPTTRSPGLGAQPVVDLPEGLEAGHVPAGVPAFPRSGDVVEQPPGVLAGHGLVVAAVPDAHRHRPVRHGETPGPGEGDLVTQATTTPPLCAPTLG